MYLKISNLHRGITLVYKVHRLGTMTIEYR